MNCNIYIEYMNIIWTDNINDNAEIEYSVLGAIEGNNDLFA